MLPLRVLLCCILIVHSQVGMIVATLIREKIPDSSSPGCKTLICEQAHEQAKGLSKLALLDEFVSQTVFLLNDLMQNINGELENSANSLLRYIHPDCGPTQQILQEVIEKQQNKLTQESGSQDLSRDVKPMSEEDPVSSGQENSLGFDYDGQSPLNVREEEEDYPSSLGKPHDKKPRKEHDKRYFEESPADPGSTSKTGNRNTGGFYGEKESPSSSSFVPSNKFGTGWNNPQGRQLDDKRRSPGLDHTNKRDFEATSDQGRDDRKRFYIKGQESNESGPGKTIIKGPDGGAGVKVTIDRKGCRGVDKGSAFWVPGLDNWCLENCSKGYCPKTHCIC